MTARALSVCVAGMFVLTPGATGRPAVLARIAGVDTIDDLA